MLRKGSVSGAAVLGLAGVAALVLSGCSGSDWKAVRYEAGDTTVVRTVSGSAWGEPARLVERARLSSDPADTAGPLRSVTALTLAPNGHLYVVDGEKPVVREYDRRGGYVRSFAMPRGQEGHYAQPNGVAVLSDGRVVIRDPRRSQLVVYSPRGEYLGRWPHPAGVYSPVPLFADPEDRLYTRVVYNPRDPRDEWQEGLVRYGPDGTIQDTIPDPVIDYVTPRLWVASARGDSASLPVPLLPKAYLAFSPMGDVVRAVSDGYALDVLRSDGRVIRLEREYEPIPVPREERAALYREVDRRARQIDYDWAWHGPQIPNEKPPFRGLFVDADGRIWVQLHQPAELSAEASARLEDVPSGEDAASADAVSADAASSDDSAASPGAAARSRGGRVREAELPDARDFREPLVFDVFEPDGRYLGQVSAPDGFRTHPQPAIRGSTVWAVFSDGEAAPSVVRFAIEH